MADDAAVDDEIRLRPVTEDDLAAFERHDVPSSDEFNWLGYRDRTGLRRQHAETGLLGPEGGYLTVSRGGSDEALGFVVWRKVEVGPAVHFWNIGISLARDARGKGYGTTAQRQLVEYLFAHTPVERVEADTEVGNIAEQRALEKAGFTREGVLRRGGYRYGRYRDLVLYSILRDEVPLD